MDRSFPTVSKALLAELDKRYPARCPRLDESDRQIWFHAGQRQVVEFLLEQKKIQDSTLLE